MPMLMATPRAAVYVVLAMVFLLRFREQARKRLRV